MTREEFYNTLEELQSRNAVENSEDSERIGDILDVAIDYVEMWQKPIKAKVGKWITKRTVMHDGEYYCSKCNKDSPLNILYNYCPNCGAKMEKVEE